jgi:hypothetical protein
VLVAHSTNVHLRWIASAPGCLRPEAATTHLTAKPERSAPRATTLHRIGDNLNAAGLSWGWFQGGFRPSTSFATATGGTQPTSTFIPNQFKGKFAVKPASDQGLCNTVHPVGVAVGGIGGTVAGANNYGNKDDYIPHHEPFQYYASTTNPRHCHRPRSRPSALIRRPRSAACRNSTRPTTSTT